MTKNSILLASFALLFSCTLPTWGQDSPAEVAEIPATSRPTQSRQRSEARYSEGITIEGTKKYIHRTSALLDSMAQLPAGAELLRELGEAGRETRIQAIPFVGAAPFASAADLSNAYYRQDGIVLRPGSGSDTWVYMDPDYEIEGFTPEIILGNQLIHALHMERGEFDDHWRVAQHGVWPDVSDEDQRTLGVGSFADEQLTVRRFREEWNRLHPERSVPLNQVGTYPDGSGDFGPSSRTQVRNSLRPQARSGPGQGLSDALGEALEDE